jgi:putative pyruvate formate lyase activating enzyme
VRRASLQADALTIVRHLVIPGHVDCCTRPVLAWLRQLQQEGGHFVVNLIEHYVPRHRAIGTADLGRLLTPEERAQARALLQEAGVRTVAAPA